MEKGSHARLVAALIGIAVVIIVVVTVGGYAAWNRFAAQHIVAGETRTVLSTPSHAGGLAKKPHDEVASKMANDMGNSLRSPIGAAYRDPASTASIYVWGGLFAHRMPDDVDDHFDSFFEGLANDKQTVAHKRPVTPPAAIGGHMACAQLSLRTTSGTVVGGVCSWHNRDALVSVLCYGLPENALQKRAVQILPDVVHPR